MNKITIRPSSLSTYINCPKKWYDTYILGTPGTYNSRAALGTAIHAGIEHMWNESIKAKEKIIKPKDMYELGIDSLRDSATRNMQYKEGETLNSLEQELQKGLIAYIEDIVPFADIPQAVELRLSFKVNNPYVEEVAGTLDYLGKNSLADVKTSARKINVYNYILQQSIYKWLAEENGYTINNCSIQGVILGKTKVYGEMYQLPDNIPQAKKIINNLLGRLQELDKGRVDPDILFPGNPSYFLCSKAYCSSYDNCPYT